MSCENAETRAEGKLGHRESVNSGFSVDRDGSWTES
jgi:hypothetical protein